jgi:hypothetical protein
MLYGLAGHSEPFTYQVSHIGLQAFVSLGLKSLEGMTSLDLQVVSDLQNTYTEPLPPTDLAIA